MLKYVAFRRKLNFPIEVGHILVIFTSNMKRVVLNLNTVSSQAFLAGTFYNKINDKCRYYIKLTDFGHW